MFVGGSKKGKNAMHRVIQYSGLSEVEKKKQKSIYSTDSLDAIAAIKINTNE